MASPEAVDQEKCLSQLHGRGDGVVRGTGTALVGFVGILVFAHHPLFYRAFFDPKLAILAWGGLLASLVLAFRYWGGHGANGSAWRGVGPWAGLGLAGIFGWVLLGAVWHRGGVSGPLTSPDWVPWAAVIVGLLPLVVPVQGLRLLVGVMAVTLVAALIGIGQAVGWDPLLPLGPYLGRNEYNRLPASTFGNPNYGALVLVPIYGFAVGYGVGYWHGRRSWRAIAPWALAAGVALVYVALTRSRGGALAIAVATVVVLMPRPVWSRSGPGLSPRPWKLRFRLALIGGGLVALILGFGLSGTLSRLASEGVGRSSVAYRLALWQDGLAMVGRAPLLGVGPGNLADGLARDGSVSLRSMPGSGFANERFDLLHQDWLQLAASRGLVVALLALGLWLGVGRQLWRRSFGRPELVPWALGGLGAFAGASVLSVLDFPFHYPPAGVVILLLVLLPFAQGGKGLVREGQFGRGNGAGGIEVLLVGLVLVFGISLVPRQAICDPLASLGLGSARGALARGDWDGAKKLAAQAEGWGADGGLVGQVMVAAARGGGASDEALAAAQKWTVDRPFDGDGWNTLGAVQAENGQLENALASLKRAVDLSPANGAAALNIAMLHQALGQYREAVQWYERVWVSHPELFKKEAGRYEEARRLLGEEPAGKGRE